MGMIIFNKQTCVWCGSIHWVSRDGPESFEIQSFDKCTTHINTCREEGKKSRDAEELIK